LREIYGYAIYNGLLAEVYLPTELGHLLKSDKPTQPGDYEIAGIKMLEPILQHFDGKAVKVTIEEINPLDSDLIEEWRNGLAEQLTEETIFELDEAKAIASKLHL